MGRRAIAGRGPGARRRVLLALAGVGLVVLAWLAWVGVDAARARNQLLAAATQVQGLEQQVLDADGDGAARTLAELQQRTAAARELTRGPHWSAARAVPWLGANVRAVQEVTDVVDGVMQDALPALLDATTLVDPASLAPVDGRIDLAPLEAAGPQVIGADAALQEAARALDAIEPAGLLPGVREPLALVRAEVDQVAATTATAARAVRLLPPMLGADGPREYLLLVQNSAEPRATGGEVGLIALLRATNGALEIVEQRGASGILSGLSEPVLPLTAEEQAIFGTGLGRYMADVTFTPDFPRSGELARAFWSQQIGGDVDGVLSIDPGALATLLGATGPVLLPTGQELTAANAAQLLLNGVYLAVEDPAEQDAFYAATAQTVFGALLGGQGEPAAMMAALAQSAREGRLMAWSSHPDEQALLAGTVLSGELVGVRGDSPVVGVFVNDGSASKIGYYLRMDVEVGTTECRADGSQALEVSVTLTSTAPANAADLPPYVAGGGIVVPKGEAQMNVLVYAPQGGRVDNVNISPGTSGVFSNVHDGLAMVGKTIRLKPGETVTLNLAIGTSSGQLGAPQLRVTPLAHGSVVIDQGRLCE
ncbi:DUF4012 domain-containing protein [Pengzhenrongella sicca]|uniref:DUF4012 domain-containing protein n=1 Tax=Pengzhenrongella sicca TaxID=2819238 RepID=A0A8A4ZAN1_9MICO|nr:DUF4012 domain-containing protein [Pengzhenrongella sicca]QTE29030.1 DUF4012 domain-containing protein [Pengzhenrongella sicca]